MTIDLNGADIALRKGTEIRLRHYRNLVKARTDRDGHPLPGYKKNVELLEREIALMEAQLAKPAQGVPDAAQA